MKNVIVLGGAEHQVAPLKSLQVAEFFDDITAAGANETRTSAVTRALRTIGRSMRNAGASQVGSDDESAIRWINETADFGEIDPAFLSVLELSGLKKADGAGEATATESTSSASSAAS